MIRHGMASINMKKPMYLVITLLMDNFQIQGVSLSFLILKAICNMIILCVFLVTQKLGLGFGM